MATKSYSTRSTLSKSRQRRPCRFGRYTLATKSKGRSTFGQQKLPTFDKVDRVEHVQHWRQCRPRHWRQSRKDVRHSGDKNYPLSTKSTELNMCNIGDNVDRDTVDKVERAVDSRLSTNRRQIGDKVDSRLCRQCVPGFIVQDFWYVCHGHVALLRTDGQRGIVFGPLCIRSSKRL